MKMIRTIINAVTEGAIKRFTAGGRIGESFQERELFQHYGFSSRPLPGAEGIVLNAGNHIVMVATDDRRYRIVLEEGEVAIYTDEGDHVHLKRGRVIEIITDTLLVKAGTKVRFETPLVESTGEITDRCASDGKSMEQMRAIYTGHTHPGDSGGTTGAPNQGM